MKFGFAIAVEAPEKFPVLYTGDPYENAKIAAMAGADTIELHLREPDLIDMKKLKQSLADNHIAVSAIGTGLAYVMDGLSLTDPDTEVREKAKKRLFAFTDMAQELGAVVILGSIRGKADNLKDYDSYASLLAKELGEVAGYAEKKQVALVLEVINRYELPFLNTAAEVRRFIDMINNPYLKLHLDTYHMNIEESSMISAILESGSYIGHVHVADNTRAFPGAGIIDFNEIISALEKVHYKGSVSMECYPIPNSAIAVKEGLKHLKESGKPLKFGVTVALEAPEGSPFPIVDTDIYATIDFVKESGFDSIELHLLHPDQIDGRAVKQYCDSKNLEISTIGTGMAVYYEGLTLLDEDKQIRRKALQRLKDQMDLAAVLECDVVLGSMRGTIGTKHPYSVYEKWMIDAMKQLAAYGGEKNVNVVIEAIDRYETNNLYSADEVLDLIEKIGSNRLKVHLDTFHMNIEEENPAAAIRRCGDHLGHFHVADNNRNYPDWGHIDFAVICKALKEIQYKNSVTIECFQIPDGKTAAKLGLEYLHKIAEVN